MNKLNEFIVIAIFAAAMAFGAAASGSQSCSDRDFRPQLGPARDQGDLGWCFAYAAADLISLKIGTRVSATDVASTFHIGSAHELMASHDPEVAKYLAKYPGFKMDLKNQRAFTSASYSEIATNTGLTDAGGVENLAIIMANLKGPCLESKYPSTDEEAEQLMKAALKIHVALEKASKSYIAIPQGDPTSAIVDGRANAVAKIYQEMVDDRCRRRPRGVSLIPVQVGPLSLDEFNGLYKQGSRKRVGFQNRLLRRLNTVLDVGRAVAFGYSEHALHDSVPADPDNGDHASVIVGRKKMDGICYYLLRNSFGSDCTEYKSGYDDRSGRCADGHIWVTAEELKRAPIYSITYIK